MGIQAFTEGVLARNESVYVQFSEVPTAEAADLITISPRVAGTASLSGTGLTFTPSEGWAPGQVYEVTVTLPDGNPFVFGFSAAARRADVVSDGLFIPGGGADPYVSGRVITSEEATVAELEKMVSATQGGKKLAVSIEAGNTPTIFSFRIPVSNRSADAAPVVITYDGTPVSFTETKGELTINVATSTDFSVESVTAADDHFVVRFNHALEDGQDLTGLISLPGGTGYTTRKEGNLLYVTPARQNLGEIEITLDGGILSSDGKRLEEETRWTVNLGRTEPNLRTVSKGTIMPHEGKRLFVFEAVGLRNVYLELSEVFAGNVTAFLQENDLGEGVNEWNLNRVGRLVARERIPLSRLSESVNTGRWSRYAIDLDDYIGDKAASLYQVRLGFTLADGVAGCESTLSDFGLTDLDDKAEEVSFDPGFRTLSSKMGSYYGISGYYEGFDWDDRQDPCKPAYYHSDRFLTQTILSSNLGLIAKRNPDRSTLVFATDLLNAAPLAGARVQAYDFQRQEVYSGTTDAAGRVAMTTETEPAFIVARAQSGDVAYLRLNPTSNQDLSRFATGGSEPVGGVQGTFYAERGVWRPGDSVFLNFVLRDPQQRIPARYPVEFTLIDARGRTVERRTVLPAAGRGHYALTFKTEAGDETGSWQARVEAGGQTYTKRLMIETVKPNRLSIDLETPTGGLTRGNKDLSLIGKWLYGAPASNLRATVSMTFTPRRPDFPKWKDFRFVDPTFALSDEETQVFDGELDEAGRTTFTLPLSGQNYPGPAYANLSTKLFEPGGNFSIDNQRLEVEPYDVYTGVNVPKDRWGSKRLPIDKDGRVEVATVNPEGAAVGGRKLSVQLFRVRWRYWWQDNYDNAGRYTATESRETIATYSTTTAANGSGTVAVRVPRWGRYLVRVCDEDGGHCAGEYFYAGYNQEETDRESASLVRPVAERTTVSVGEQVNVKLPTSAGAKMLVSLETGVGSIEQFWVDTEAGQTSFSFTADERMVPNVYASVTVLQPYEQTTNDRPVRLYGLVPITVEDQSTILKPLIATAAEFAPRETVRVGVSEGNGQPMTYTLAVVDEGLLGLTRFQTPDLHGRFFAKQALSVQTYDLYRYVVGSLNGAYGKVLAIGGDGSGESGEEEQSANRFEPVVRHLGPFRLAAGQRANHDIDLPNYVGAVRVMVVAHNEKAYGSADERVPVVQPLMVLPTLPRVLGPGERVDMPVTVFTMKDKVRNVSVQVDETEGLAAAAKASQSLTFSQAGNQLAYFPITVGEQAGIAHFNVTGSGNGERASQEIEIDVRHPNEVETRTDFLAIPAGESRQLDYALFGVPGTRAANLELSTLPALQLERRLGRLLRYPYGCAEQTTSPAFAQVYLDQLAELTPAQNQQRRSNVSAAIRRLVSFQTGSGGMAYWPGERTPHPWASNYIFHFLLEARNAGFSVPGQLLSNLQRFQRRQAAQWSATNSEYYVSNAQRRRDQAYRLYTLAVARQADIGAMNRLRGQAAKMPKSALFQLAAAYALLGQEQTAKELVSGKDGSVDDYQEFDYTFGSGLRDMAMILEAQLAVKDDQAGRQAYRLAESVSKRRYLSTQEAAFAFVAIAKYSKGAGSTVKATFTPAGGSATDLGANDGLVQIELPTTGNTGPVTVRNNGTGTLYTVVITEGRPRPGEEQTRTENLKLSVTYTDKEGNALDVSSLPSGTEFLATYRVTNTGTLGQDYRQMALRSLVPSGWEISNDRLDATGDADQSSYTYRDFRDDRVYTFFHLPRNKSKTFTLKMTATYPGRFYLPTQLSEAMYVDEVQATVKGRWIEVTKPAK